MASSALTPGFATSRIPCSAAADPDSKRETGERYSSRLAASTFLPWSLTARLWRMSWHPTHPAQRCPSAWWHMNNPVAPAASWSSVVPS